MNHESFSCSLYFKSNSKVNQEGEASQPKFSRCNRFAFTPLTQELVNNATRKGLSFFCSKDEIHPLICLSHKRLLMQSAKFNNERDLLLSQSDVSERRELSEFLDMFSEFAEEATLPSKKTTDAELSDLCIKLKSPKFRNLYQRYQINKEKKSYDDSTDTHNVNISQRIEPHEKNSEIRFNSLPAISLRRYKKYFKLPNRSGASSRAQLLDGMDAHISSLSTDYLETAANFLYTVSKKNNQLDY